MSIEQRPNSTVALVCDHTGCHMEVLGPVETDAREDANLMGWFTLDKGAKHTCPDCKAGRNPAAVAQFGSDTATLSAPMSYSKGDAFHHPATGDLLGHVAADVQAGEEMIVNLITVEQADAAAATGPAPEPAADNVVPLHPAAAGSRDPNDHGVVTVLPDGTEVPLPFVHPGPDPADVVDEAIDDGDNIKIQMEPAAPQTPVPTIVVPGAVAPVKERAFQIEDVEADDLFGPSSTTWTPGRKD